MIERLDCRDLARHGAGCVLALMQVQQEGEDCAPVRQVELDGPCACEVGQLRQVVLVGADGVVGEAALGAQVGDEVRNTLDHGATLAGCAWRAYSSSPAPRMRTARARRSSSSTKASRTSFVPWPGVT